MEWLSWEARWGMKGEYGRHGRIMYEERKRRLGEFVEWVGKHISGDEKGEAQVFLDRLLAAFGQGGLLETGGKGEFRIKKAAEDGGGTGFADYVWKPVVLVEMKKRGVDLGKHRRQAEEYWWRLVPNRPQYVVLCNFDEFWVFDFNTQIDSPKDVVKLKELPERWGALAFLFPTNEKPSFGNDREAVTREAADRLARCYTKLEVRKVEEGVRRRFILQMLVALFAEDIGLLPKYLVTNLLEECKKPGDSYDLLGELFVAMNELKGVSGGRYKGVRYFNGGLFAEAARVELYEDEVNQLKEAAKSDWSKVSPEIFGTLFEHSLGRGERHAFGAHFTSPVDIMKIVKPTIVEPWEEQIEGAKTLTRLRELQARMSRYRVLDPACGSGNFLYIAYRELKRLEARIVERIVGEFPGQRQDEQPHLSFVTARQFYGMDINKLGIELAKVTMMMARKLAIDELHVHENALPLDNLDGNFRCVDALIDEEGRVREWPAVDVIIGNPPYLGSRYIAKEHGYPYARKLHEVFPDVPQMADYCVYWFRRAHDVLPAEGRAGLVGTNKVRMGESREASLDYILMHGGTITEAVSTQPWSGEAKVHVSIVNWIKGDEPGRKQLHTQAGNDSKGDWTVEEVDHIDGSLSSRIDVSSAQVLRVNIEPKMCYQGQIPCHDGFLLAPAEARATISTGAKTKDVIFPYLIGRDIVGDGRPSRWIIDFGQRDMIEAAGYKVCFERVQKLVMPAVLARAEEEKKATGKEKTRWSRMAERWWQFRDYQPGTMRAIASVPRYIACSRVTKRPIFVFVSNGIHPDSALSVFPFADDYSFGVLQSAIHWAWFMARCSTLKSDFRYTSETVFDTFPWPQGAGKREIEAVAEAGREVRRVRGEALGKIKGGLRAVYRTMELPGRNPLKEAHGGLDEAVMSAYGFSGKKDLLGQLLELNLEVGRREQLGERVVGPGVPEGYGDGAGLVSGECVGEGGKR